MFEEEEEELKNTPEEILLLNKYHQNKSIENRNILIEYYDLYVWKIAWKVSKKTGEDRDDLHTHGIFGLIQAIERYDITKNDNFTAYASMRIRGNMIDGIRKEEKLRSKKHWNYKEQSLNLLTADEDTYFDESHIKELAVTDTIREEFEFNDFFAELVKTLEPREQKIAYKYFHEHKTMKAIGKELDISESRISQIVKNIIKPHIKISYVLLDV